MYGLFEYTYDYYEFENLICVSKHIEKLDEECRQFYFYPPIRCEDYHKELAETKTVHYLIKKLKKL